MASSLALVPSLELPVSAEVIALGVPRCSIFIDATRTHWRMKGLGNHMYSELLKGRAGWFAQALPEIALADRQRADHFDGCFYDGA